MKVSESKTLPEIVRTLRSIDNTSKKILKWLQAYSDDDVDLNPSVKVESKFDYAAKLVSAMEAILDAPFDQVVGYKLNRRMHAAGIVPQSVLSRKLSATAAFKNAKVGAAKKLEVEIHKAVNKGLLQPRDHDEIKTEFGFGGKCFSLVNRAPKTDDFGLLDLSDIPDDDEYEEQDRYLYGIGATGRRQIGVERGDGNVVVDIPDPGEEIYKRGVSSAMMLAVGKRRRVDNPEMPTLEDAQRDDPLKLWALFPGQSVFASLTYADMDLIEVEMADIMDKGRRDFELNVDEEAHTVEIARVG